jgi:hypothetical protein
MYVPLFVFYSEHQQVEQMLVSARSFARTTPRSMLLMKFVVVSQASVYEYSLAILHTVL